MALTIPRTNVLTPQQAYDDMLGVTDNETIIKISADLLVSYQNQPFKCYDKDRLADLADDILQNGIISPVIVRKHPTEPDKYEILAGHNRTRASKQAGILDIPCIIKQADDYVAALIMVNTNLNQRQELLPSEKALAYKLQHECLSRINGQSGVVKELAARSNESVRQVQRYIKLAELSSPLLSLVDDGQITVLAGVELAYIEQRNQEHLCEYLLKNKAVKIDIKNAVDLRTLTIEKDLYADVLDKFFNPEKKAQASIIKVKYDSIAKYIPSECENTENYIIKALDYYQNRNEK